MRGPAKIFFPVFCLICLASCILPCISRAADPGADRKLSDSTCWMLTLDNIISYSRGTGELYEDYLERDYNRISLNSDLVIAADYFITRHLAAGLRITGYMNWWGDHYETDLAGGPGISFYFRHGERVRPFAQIWYGYDFFREFAGAGITRKRSSLGGSAGLLFLVSQNTGFRLSASYSRDTLRIHNSASGNLVSLNAGVSLFL